MKKYKVYLEGNLKFEFHDFKFARAKASILNWMNPTSEVLMKWKTDSGTNKVMDCRTGLIRNY